MYKTNREGDARSSIHPSIRLGMSLRARPVCCLKADNQPDTRVDT